MLDKEIYSGSMTQANSSSCRTWFHRVTSSLTEIELQQVCLDCALLVEDVKHSVDTKLHELCEQKWREKFNTDITVRGPRADGDKPRHK